jgi:hypothetical protein
MIRYIKWGIWAYVLLLIFEGALRKWILPGASDVLLLVRDPVVAAIYGLAIAQGIFPRNGFIGFTFVLAVLSAIFPFLGGQGNIWVTIYGVRTNYFHLPLIWVMASTLTRRDVRLIGYALLAITIPMTLLMVMQNRSPSTHWLNLGAGGGEGGQIHGAMGRIRPPGFFSFITGPMVFFPLVTAFFLAYVTEKKKWYTHWFVIAAGICIALALPISISRGMVVICGWVTVVFFACIFLKGAFNAAFARVIVSALLVVVALRFLPVTQEAWIVFMDRWNQAASEVQGDAWGSLTDRVASGFTAPFELMLDVPFFGHGIGVGSNVGAKLLSGRLGFLLSENEWERAMLELGPLVGLGFLGLRVALTLHLLTVSWQAFRRRGEVLPMLITAASIPPLLLQQWSQATQLGFAVVDAGLVLALVNAPDDAGDDDEEFEGDLDDEDDEDSESKEEENEDEEDPLSEYEKRRRRMRGLA